jgi:hypothetical protein
MSANLSLPPIEIMASAAADLAAEAQDAGNRPLLNALNKAMLQLHEGCAPVPTIGGFLVESRTRSGTVHRLSVLHGCSCEAATNGKACWHTQLMTIIERAAQSYTMPALPSYVQAKREIDADLTARQQAAQDALNELYA